MAGIPAIVARPVDPANPQAQAIAARWDASLTAFLRDGLRSTSPVQRAFFPLETPAGYGPQPQRQMLPKLGSMLASAPRNGMPFAARLSGTKYGGTT